MPKRILHDEDIPGDDGEEMASLKDGIYGCGGRLYRRGCNCPDCTDRGDWEYEQKRDREMLKELGDNHG